MQLKGNSGPNTDGNLVEWGSRYCIGIPQIDSQHKELIRLTNELYQGCRTGDDAARLYFLKAIKGTVDYVKEHFSLEEKMLENIRYPELAEHKKQHEEFVLQILEDVKNFEGGKRFVPNDFVRYLREWILSHIGVADKRYSDYILDLKKQGLLGKS